MILTSVASVFAAALVIFFANEGNDSTGRRARCFMGFFVAIVWIMAIADEVVAILQVSSNIRLTPLFNDNCSKTFGFIFGLSDAIIGL
jgi:solute carrier family 24 (sodium/potassium/calcium exchanger), member 6